MSASGSGEMDHALAANIIANQAMLVWLQQNGTLSATQLYAFAISSLYWINARTAKRSIFMLNDNYFWFWTYFCSTLQKKLNLQSGNPKRQEFMFPTSSKEQKYTDIKTYIESKIQLGPILTDASDVLKILDPIKEAILSNNEQGKMILSNLAECYLVGYKIEFPDPNDIAPSYKTLENPVTFEAEQKEFIQELLVEKNLTELYTSLTASKHTWQYEYELRVQNIRKLIDQQFQRQKVLQRIVSVPEDVIEKVKRLAISKFFDQEDSFIEEGVSRVLSAYSMLKHEIFRIGNQYSEQLETNFNYYLVRCFEGPQDLQFFKLYLEGEVQNMENNQLLRPLPVESAPQYSPARSSPSLEFGEFSPGSSQSYSLGEESPVFGSPLTATEVTDIPPLSDADIEFWTTIKKGSNKQIPESFRAPFQFLINWTEKYNERNQAIVRKLCFCSFVFDKKLTFVFFRFRWLLFRV